jgi:membrane protease YdiL (CAAX protease family)
MPFRLNPALAALLPLVYLSAAALLAAAFAYPLYLLSGGGIGLRSLVSRGALVFLILGGYLLVRKLGLDLAQLGFARGGSGFPRQAIQGFGLGVLMLALHTLALLALDVRVMDPDDWKSTAEGLSTLAKALGTGIAIALIEETIFRGLLFTALRRLAGVGTAIVVSAFYYAILHFLKTDWKPKGAEVAWDTGFRLLADAFGHLAVLPFDSLLALFLAGVLLGCVRTAFPLGLGYCVGLHAGWVFVIRSAKALTNGLPDGRHAYLVGGYDGIIGYLAAGWIGVLVLGFMVSFRGKGRRSALAERIE